MADAFGPIGAGTKRAQEMSHPVTNNAVRPLPQQIGDAYGSFDKYVAASPFGQAMQGIMPDQDAMTKQAAEISLGMLGAGTSVPKAAGEGGHALGMFLGPRSRTADHDALAMAKNLEVRSGASPEAILDETGWFRGADGMWRYEIPDNDLQLSQGTDINDRYTQYKGFEHPELNAAYPNMDKLLFSGHVGPYQPPGGSFQGFGGDNALATSSGTDDDMVRKFLSHELQHYVQSREGFNFGGNPKATDVEVAAMYHGKKPFDVYQSLAGETEARGVEKRLDFTADQRKQLPPWMTQDRFIDELYLRKPTNQGGAYLQPMIGMPRDPRIGGWW